MRNMFNLQLCSSFIDTYVVSNSRAKLHGNCLQDGPKMLPDDLCVGGDVKPYSLTHSRSKKSKPAYFCNTCSFLCCQPILII